uniref:Large ribosomal subunit protein uL24c n=1 Tax=Caloglossa intermedia TaxID=100879 RepID=A0A1Z1M6L3_9FLOR|nr:ribosomal protein L24 [Caloglossa intermedia]ARW61503.1 ribosomal protein L24 [Caloglossa intermedia]
MIKRKQIKLKVGDYVKIISGKYKNESGKIIKIITKKNSAIVENINLKTKHIKPTREEEKGNIEQIEGPIHISNIKKESDQSS